MLTKDKVFILKEIEKTVSIILQKLDKENELYVSVLELNKKQREILVKAIDEFEKKLQVFLINQKKDYLAAMKKFPEYIKRQGKIKHTIKKAEAIDEFIVVLSSFLFAN